MSTVSAITGAVTQAAKTPQAKRALTGSILSAGSALSDDAFQAVGKSITSDTGVLHSIKSFCEKAVENLGQPFSKLGNYGDYLSFLPAFPLSISNLFANGFGVFAAENLIGAFTKSGKGPIQGAFSYAKNFVSSFFAKNASKAV